MVRDYYDTAWGPANKEGKGVRPLLYRLGQRQLAKNASTPDTFIAEVPSLELVFHQERFYVDRAFGRGGSGGAKNWKVRSIMRCTMMQQQGNGRQDGPDQGQGGKQSFYVFHVNRVLWKVYLIR